MQGKINTSEEKFALTRKKTAQVSKKLAQVNKKLTPVRKKLAPAGWHVFATSGSKCSRSTFFWELFLYVNTFILPLYFNTSIIM